MDTQPLRSPGTWIAPSDLEAWSDPITNTNYSVAYREGSSSRSRPVGIILGLEADCDPEADQYWRMGYSYPVQLTQWALASSPAHPLLQRYMDNLNRRLDGVADRNGGDLRAMKAHQELQALGPLILTGPAAITVAAMSWLAENAGMRWNALTGLHDGGRSKVVEDVMILPITGFRYGVAPIGCANASDIRQSRSRPLW